MINLQNPQIPTPIQAIEIDKAIYELQLLLDTNIDWLTHNYGRSYRFIEKVEKRLYIPEIYVGGENYDYLRVSPDNDKKGTCFFVVGKEENYDYETHQKNNLRYKVGIVFWVNLEKINKTLLKNEKYTQNLIRDVRNVLTMRGGGLSFSYKIETVEREFREIYREFNLDETNDYLRSPYDGFRFNLELIIPSDCEMVSYDPKRALLQNLSQEEKLTILASLDFTDPQILAGLTEQQKQDLGIINN
jgi:hypothetical protein